MTPFAAEDSPAESPRFDPAREAKLLLRTTRSAALATLVPQSGQPFATLVNVASAPDGSPILLLSELAAHSRHIAVDPRLSLLYCAPGRGDPLAHPRLTILGRAQAVQDADLRAALRTRFLGFHPKSALYADFPDFSFFLVEIESAHLNGGFARAASLATDDIRTNVDGAAQLIAAEPDAIAHINADHSDVGPLLAAAFGEPANLDRGRGAWRAIGLDPEGIDLGNDTAIVRVRFPRPVTTPAALRQTLVELAAAARRVAI
jgi:heme iron utilization protein